MMGLHGRQVLMRGERLQPTKTESQLLAYQLRLDQDQGEGTVGWGLPAKDNPFSWEEATSTWLLPSAGRR